MQATIKTLWTAAIVTVLMTGVSATVAQDSLGSDSPTDTYMHDARPTELFYLSLIQSGPVVSGYAVIVGPGTYPEADDVLASRTS